MLQFEFRPAGHEFVLSGGQLEQPLRYSEKESALHVVGFLSQRDGSELRIFDAAGNLLETQTREPTAFIQGSVGPDSTSL
jgi:hypothetical protein